MQTKEQDNRNIARAALKVARQVEGNKARRTYTDRDGNAYTLEMELRRPELLDGTAAPWELAVTTWGYDYATIPVPTTRNELVRGRMAAQLRDGGGFHEGLEVVALRYYLDVAHEADRQAAR